MRCTGYNSTSAEGASPRENAAIYRSWSAAEPLPGARMATCPDCEFDDIDTADQEEGDTVSCSECGKNLVLLGADELDFADEDDDADGDTEDE